MVDAAAQVWVERLRAARDRLAASRVDALLISHSANIRYLTGFAGTAGLVVLTPDRVVFIADGRYDRAVRDGMAAGSLAAMEIRRVERRYDLTLASVLEGLRATRVGFEADHVTVANAAAWARATDRVAWMPVNQMIEPLRLIKDAVEIASLRRAGDRLAGVVRALPDLVVPGRTELAVARAIDDVMFNAGFSEVAFKTIVASGPHSAYPHARPTERRLAAGDLVVLDFGGVLDGYCVDLTRAAAIRPVSADAERLYDAVARAHAAALASVRPGVELAAIDGAAREVLEASGLGEAFSHSTGHGLGLEVHEAPRIGRVDPDRTAEHAAAGMVFTIEPGAYVDGLGGVRLEDDVLVTAGGCEVLTEAPRDLLIV